MADIQIHCGQCGAVYQVDRDAAGGMAVCPECGKEVALPKPAAPDSISARLHVMKDTTISGNRRCPRCDASLAADAIICYQCGYDLRDDVDQDSSSISIKLPAWLLPAIALLAWSAAVWFFGYWSGKTIAARAAEQELAIQPQAPALPQPASNQVAEPVVPAARARTLTPAQIAEQEARRQAEIARREEEQRIIVRQQLDQKFPFVPVGASVSVRRTNGQMHRGIVKALAEDHVVLITDGQDVEIPMNVLDQPSRLQCDKAFRERFIDFRAKQKAQNPEGP